MCDFISWIRLEERKEPRIKFLTTDLIPKALELGIDAADLTGHEAIRRVFGISPEDGVEEECSDFSSPANFPPQIAVAIVDGRMIGFGPIPAGILCKPLEDDYRAKRKPLEDDYWAKSKPLEDDYRAKRKPLEDDYWAKRKVLNDDYFATRTPLEDDYWAKSTPLNDDYRAKRKVLDDDYRAKRKVLEDDYWAKLRLLEDDAWHHILDATNRSEAWQTVGQKEAS